MDKLPRMDKIPETYKMPTMDKMPRMNETVTKAKKSKLRRLNKMARVAK